MIDSLSPTISLADWTQDLRRSVLRQMISVVSQPGILSLAGGLPDPALFPTAGYAAALQTVLEEDPKALQYNPPVAALKRHIAALMAERGVTCSEEQVFITTGAQQGLDLLTRLLLNPGDDVLLEEVVYSGVRQVLTPYRPRILTVGTDLRQGIDVTAVAGHLAAGARPAYIYVIPDGHNPLGVSLSAERRAALVDLARSYGVPIIEDDPYGHLYYDGRPAPPLRALDDELVFYLGSFSKIMAPALRLGWLIAPPQLLQKLQVVKESMDLESSALTQRAVAAYMDAGHLPAHIQRLRETYGRRRDVMLAALARYFPAEARWTRPQAGMFVWVELPRRVDAEELLQTAVVESQVAFIPGHAFAIRPEDGSHCMRLNFTNCTSDQIKEGVRRLAAVLHREL